MFQLKDMVSISAGMINRAKATQTKITDFNVGSVARTILESSAIEVEQFYQRMFYGILEAIPTAIYLGFEFALIQSTAARGLVTINFGGPVVEAFTIPAGTIFVNSSNNITSLSVQSVPVAVGLLTINVLVECSQVGSVGNAAYGDINATKNYDFPIGSIVIGNAITSGSDGETETERKARFSQFITTLARGTNGAVEYGARMAQVFDANGILVDYVSRIGFLEVPGTMDVFIYGANQLASTDLVVDAQKLVDGYWDEINQTFVAGYRPVGIRVRVFAMQEQSIDAIFTVEMFAGVALDNTVKNNILNSLSYQITSVEPSFVLFVENLDNAVLSTAGVKAVRNNLLENITCPFNTALVMGNLQVVEGVA